MADLATGRTPRKVLGDAYFYILAAFAPIGRGNTPADFILDRLLKSGEPLFAQLFPDYGTPLSVQDFPSGFENAVTAYEDELRVLDGLDGDVRRLARTAHRMEFLLKLKAEDRYVNLGEPPLPALVIHDALTIVDESEKLAAVRGSDVLRSLERTMPRYVEAFPYLAKELEVSYFSPFFG